MVFAVLLAGTFQAGTRDLSADDLGIFERTDSALPGITPTSTPPAALPIAIYEGLDRLHPKFGIWPDGLHMSANVFAYAAGASFAAGGTVSGTVTDSPGGAPRGGVTVNLGAWSTTTNGSGVYTFTGIPAGTYLSMTATFPGYVTGSANNIVVTDDATTPQNFSLAPAPAAACLTDTTQSDFQSGVGTNVDVTTSPGDVTLNNAPILDQQNTAGTTTGTGFGTSAWTGQTFIAGTTGPLVKAEFSVFCSGCGATPPNLTLSVRATSAGLPIGADLASVSVPGSTFASGATVTYQATFGSPATVTSGTQYALILRPVSAPAGSGYFWIRSSPTTYANGSRVVSANSGGTWSADATRDYNFKTYVQVGYPASGHLISSVRDSNPAPGYVPTWQTLSWTASIPTSTTVRFQVAASNSVGGPFDFVGPDTTAATFFTTTGASLSQFNGKRYLQYKAYLTSSDSAVTPTLNDVTTCYDTLPDLTITDVSANEGITGTTTFSFTVSLSAPAAAGGVTFDITTSPNSATAPADYTTKTLTSQSIPAGSSSYTFDVLVNGEYSVESDETFFVNVTNLTGANAVDVQGQGTITNDDTVNDPPTLDPIADPSAIDEDAGVQTVSLSGIGSGTAGVVQSLTVTATSNNTGLIPNPTVTYTSPDATGSLSYTPLADQHGTAIITVTVNDNGGGTETVQQTFTVNVTAVNDPPTLAAIANPPAISEDAGLQTVTFSGVRSGNANETQSLTVTAISNNTGLIPNPMVTYTSPDATGSLSYTPLADQDGTAIITVTVNDNGGGTETVQQMFTVNVTAVNDPPTISAVANQTATADTVIGPLAFTVGDIDNSAASLTPTGSSSDQAVVTNAGITFGGSGANRTVTITPVPGQSGQATIVVNVSDGTASTPTQFVVTYPAVPDPPPEPTPDNQPPTLSGVSDLTIEETTTRILTLTVSSDATSAVDLVVTASSSNQTLLPNANLALSGSGGTRTLTLTPVAEQVGQTTINVTVSDGALTTTRTALITVTTAPPPLPPAGLVGTALGTEVTLTWVEAATGATPTFFVIEGGSASGLTTLPVVVTPRVNQWVLQLPAGVYFIRVRAANRAGTSAPSNEAPVLISSATPLPGPPVGLGATVQGSLVNLGWQPSSGGGAPAIWRLELGSTTGGIDRGMFTVAAAVTSVSGALPDGEYFARIRGTNAAGAGQPSNEVRFRVGDAPACDVPQSPVLLPATITGRLVTLGWHAPGNVAGAGYRLLVGSTPGGSNLAAIDVGPVTAFTATAPPGVYYVTVLALGSCGASMPSNSIVVSVDTLEPPGNLTASVTGGQVALSWGAVAGAVSYRLEAGFGPGLSNVATASVTSTGLVVTGVPSGTYYLRVRAVNASGATSARSADIAVVVP